MPNHCWATKSSPGLSTPSTPKQTLTLHWKQLRPVFKDVQKVWCATDESWRGQPPTLKKFSPQFYAIHIRSSFENHTKFPEDTIPLNIASAILLRLGHSPNRNARFVRPDQVQENHLLIPVPRPHTLKHWILRFNITEDGSQWSKLFNKKWVGSNRSTVSDVSKLLSFHPNKYMQFRGRTVLLHPFLPSKLCLNWALSSEHRRREPRISSEKATYLQPWLKIQTLREELQYLTSPVPCFKQLPVPPENFGDISANSSHHCNKDIS